MSGELGRIARFIVRNWPLKLAAIALATLLYVGLVVSRDSDLANVSVPIESQNLPANTILTTNLGDVEQIRYFAPPDVRVDSSAFEASVDLSGVNPEAGPVSLPVEVVAIDPRITVISTVPDRVNVVLERLVEKRVDVVVKQIGAPPENLDVREPEVDPPDVLVKGPESAVREVVSAEARVQIDPSGIDFDRDVELIPVDASGEALQRSVDVDPPTARVRIPVFTDLQTKTLPVHAEVTGTPAAGFEVASVKVDPPTVLVEGDADQLAPLERVDTEPVSITGATSDRTLTVPLALPTGVLALDDATVRVTVVLRPVTASRTYSAGVTLRGARPDTTYELDVDRVLLTVGGPVGDLDRLSAATLTAFVDVAGLEPGSRVATVFVDLPSGLTLIASSPPSVTVTVTGPAGAATSVAPSASASPSPSASPPHQPGP